ncbi:protein bicaudal C homolog 1-B isoform X2 [Cimex lectularius]|uniref:SAM domain-containing protein n=1 Tax=Cimex lectularius TaxID=79782 RepID=A0A8I6RNQ7_CIMLE|nr:protein bicaudal C homolog 1-B isoform X2 [Cimex lectularius]
MSIRGEAMSETNSDCTAGRESSIGSREDLQEIMTNLGISSVDLLAQDRFRVDRKLLENLLFGGDKNAASDLFLSIMRETRTHIAWPSRLKLNAKSKKDPHIRILGRTDDVKLAHDRVLATLGPKGNRVNMKIDVSYTEHSHIIGKGGLTIKRVMEETACHIHFPDSNRSNPVEKSNQVSIAGDVAGVEKARAKVRELTPLIFCFELPILEAPMLSPDQVSPYIKDIQDTYNVQVMYRTRQKLYSTLVVVKGCEWEVSRVKEATKLLIAHMCKSLADHVTVQVMLEISPHHHSVVLGKNNENLKAIMMNTKTQITFIDPIDPNIPSLKKSNVTITGSINDVYLARQQLIGSLPVLFMFDVPETSPAVETTRISDIMNKQNVLITTRHKVKQNIITFIIKGIERNIGDIYEAHKRLIGSNEPSVQVEIPQSYFIPNSSPIYKPIWNCNDPAHPTYQNLTTPVLLSPMIGRSEPLWSHIPHYMLAQHLTLPPSLSPLPYHSDLNHYSYSTLSLPEFPVYSSMSSNASSLSSSRTTSPIPYPVPEKPKPELATSCEEPDQSKIPPGFKRPMLTHSDFQKFKIQAMQAMRKSPNATNFRVPTSTWSGYGFSHSSPTSSLLELKTNKEKTVKFDKDKWMSGSGEFSPTQSDTFTSSVSTECNPLASSNIYDSITKNTLSTITSLPMSDLSTLLVNIGLEQYIRLFESQEIDLMTFKTLTDLDLKEIGVSALGARRKLMLCIAELNKRQRSPFRGSAAPGAERKNPSTNSLNDLTSHN